MKKFLGVAILILLTACGVEAGNPGGEKPKTGALVLSFSRQARSAEESLVLNFKSFDLLTSDSADKFTRVEASAESAELFGLTDSATVVADAATVPTGDYTQIVVRLKDNTPVAYRDRDGKGQSISFGGANKDGFIVRQPFSVLAGEATNLVINIDPYNSFQPPLGPGRPLRFEPLGSAAPRGYGAQYRGQTALTGATWVCAYAYGADKPAPDFGARPRPDLPQGRLSPRGSRLEPPPVFANRQAIIFDATSRCEHAYAKAPVFAGAFELRHLPPGRYAVRAFTAQDEFLDAAEDISPQGPHPLLP